MTVELPTPQNTDYTNYGFDIKSKICISLLKPSGPGRACEGDNFCWYQNRPGDITHKHITYTVCSTHTFERWDENIAWPSAHIRADTGNAEVAKPRNLPSWPHLVPLTVSPSRSSFTPRPRTHQRQDVRLWLQGRLRGGRLWQGQGLDQECMFTFLQSSNFQTQIMLFGNPYKWAKRTCFLDWF